jgi:hypothetical protein
MNFFRCAEMRQIGGFLSCNRCNSTNYCTAGGSEGDSSLHLSGSSRSSRFPKVSIQRFLGCFRLQFRRDYVQKVQHLQQNLHFELSQRLNC